jgi:hypothetical protein
VSRSRAAAGRHRKPPAARSSCAETRSFTIFLQEDCLYRPEAGRLPRLCSQAITGPIFEILQREVAAGDFARIVSRLPQLAYVAIALFAGADEAIGLVEGANWARAGWLRHHGAAEPWVGSRSARSPLDPSAGSRRLLSPGKREASSSPMSSLLGTRCARVGRCSMSAYSAQRRIVSLLVWMFGMAYIRSRCT